MSGIIPGTVAVYGGSFSMPTLAHLVAMRVLLGIFERVIVIPCGTRPDKLYGVDGVHRARMLRAAIASDPALGRIELDLSDLEREEFTPTIVMDRVWRDRLEPGRQVWHVVGSDLLIKGEDGLCEIERSWQRGTEVWQDLNLAVLPRPGSDVPEEDLPPHRLVLQKIDRNESSSEVRDLLARGRVQEARAHLPAAVGDYIERFGLYGRSFGPKRIGRMVLGLETRFKIVIAEEKPRAREIADALRVALPVTDAENPDVILAIGGDGHMLDVIGEYGEQCPILGINAGHVGFLLNEVEPDAFVRHLFGSKPFESHLLPMLEAMIQKPDGNWIGPFHGVNDAWLERETTQTAWFRVEVDGDLPEVTDRLMCDAVLVATPAGSTAYAKAMGAARQRLDANLLTLAAACPSFPDTWHNDALPEDREIFFTVLDPEKRPVRAVIDGRTFGGCIAMRVRQSRACGIELMFLPGQSLRKKNAQRC